MQSINPAVSAPCDPRNRRRLGLLLAGVYRQWRRQVDQSFRHLELTDATRMPLLALYDHGQPMRQKELAQALALEPSSLVRVLALLCAKDWLQWQADELDGRAKCFFLTPEGEAIAQVIVEKSMQIEQQILAQLSPEELAVTRSALEKITQRLQQL